MDTQVVVVLDREQYERLVKKVGYNTAIDNNSTDNTVAFKLGVQHALTTLRDGFVVDVPVHLPTEDTGVVSWIKRKWRKLWAG